MGFKVFGIGAVQLPDKVGEIIEIDGVDISMCGYLNDEHTSGNMSTIGAISKIKKIRHSGECATPREEQCWNSVNAPFLYFEGELADDQGHPDAQATAALIKFANTRPELPLEVGASIEGLTLKRGGPKDSPEYKRIKAAFAEGLALTIKPCQPACKVFPMQTLTKSDMDAGLSQEAIDRVMFAPPKTSSILSSPTLKGDLQTLITSIKGLSDLLSKASAEGLQKSLDDWNKGGTSSLKCTSCEHVERLFKTSRKWPNRCPHCGKAFSMSELWSAMNQ